MKPPQIVVAVVLVLIVMSGGSRLFKAVPAGHVAVGTLFGAVKDTPYGAGLHIPVNPLYKWTVYDARQKTHKETAGVPSQDQLTTTLEVSVQYRIDQKEVSNILGETGTAADMLAVHLVPKLRSLLREQGKTIKRAEDFFLEATQARLQDALTTDLFAFLQPKGIVVGSVLIRDIRLPEFITKAIERKKEREQEVERQKAELERYRTEQQQKVAAAKAEREAAEEEATKRKLLADAQAYEIKKINEAIADNQSYIQLQALEALKSISSDPAAKIYFLNSDSPMPLPLMHLGEPMGAP